MAERPAIGTIRLTDLEAETLARAAQAAGLPPSKLARARLFSTDVDERIARLERLIRRLAGL